eukprot:241545-Pleurochrysis_carterae.AAC.1
MPEPAIGKACISGEERSVPAGCCCWWLVGVSTLKLPCSIDEAFDWEVLARVPVTQGLAIAT